MPSFRHAARRRAAPSDDARTAQPADSPVSDLLMRSPRVQEQLQLQQAIDDSPRVVAQAKFVDVIQRLGSDDEEAEEDEEDEEQVVSSYDEALELLAKSSPSDPLSEGQMAAVKEFIEANVGRGGLLSRTQSAELQGLLKKAEGHVGDYQALLSSRRPRPSRKRKLSTGGGEPEPKRKKVKTFENPDESEVSDEESDFDERLKKHMLPMAPIMGRSHVPGIEDPSATRKFATGLPYADTYLGLFKDSSLVPREINGKPNFKARRKRMRDVNRRVTKSQKKRDERFAKYDRLNKEIAEKGYKGTKLDKKIEERDDAFNDVSDILKKEIRPHIEPLYFGSSLAPTEEDFEASEDPETKRTEIKESLLKSRDRSAVGVLANPPTEKGLTGYADTGTHAEQSLLGTKTWHTMIDGLIEAIKENKDKPEELEKQSGTSIALVLNRSTCLGCARELTMELVRFWTLVAEETELDDWREAKLAYEGYVNFIVTFPSIYEAKLEKKIDYRNFQRIIAGLQDAGWRTEIHTGISASKKSDAANTAAATLVENYNAVPRYHVKGWSQKIQRFAIPAELKDAVAESGQVIVNGIRYVKVKGANDVASSPDAKASKLPADTHFNKTGSIDEPQTEDMEESESKKPKSKWAKEYEEDPYDSEEDEIDPGLQTMLDDEGYTIENVSGRGMNCLIRAIFRSAGIDYDETMVAIVRRHLIEQGVTEKGNMLDLLGTDGATLIQFLQRQRVLPAGTGLTVHFPGNSFPVVAGANQIHIWYSEYHFQAIVGP